MNLEAEHIMTIHVQCDSNLDIKDNGIGYLRVIPIVGGTVEGKITGEVVPGGADWNTSLDSDLAHVHAKYLLRTSDGEYIDVQNEGIIKNDTNNKIKTRPCFKADIKGKYAWLNHGVYVASLDPGKEHGQVIITVYKLK
ncbi:MAG: DUF3237 domain-containing protein [Clostridiales bacterium]|nr:DUF3237 domain-containing protein [Clostridiales bacterium]